MENLNVVAAVAGQNLPANPTSGMQTFALFILFFFPSVAIIIVVIRAVGRWSSRQFGWDDGLICTAMLMSVAETFASYKFIKTNFVGIPGSQIPPHNMTEAMIWNYAVQILYNPILALVKASVLVFLLRLFGQKDGVRTYIIALNTANLLQMVAVFFAIVFQCWPIEFNWNKALRGGRCVDQRVLYTSTASFTILTDLLVLALPLYIFKDLKIPRRTKIALLFVFLLGGLVTIASIARLVILVQGLFGLVVSADPTYNIGFVTSAIETNLALITASAPALMPMLKSWFPSLFGSDGGISGETKKMPLRDMKANLELRGQTPRVSEEEAMTYNGIVRQNEMVSRLQSEMVSRPDSEMVSRSRDTVNYSRPGSRPGSARPERPYRPGDRL